MKRKKAHDKNFCQNLEYEVIIALTFSYFAVICGLMYYV